MSPKKKVWTFDSICRAARRGREWGIISDPEFRAVGMEAPKVVACALGFCPLGAVFTAEEGTKRPSLDDLDGYPVSVAVANSVIDAADNVRDKNHPRMLKLLGVKA